MGRLRSLSGPMMSQRTLRASAFLAILMFVSAAISLVAATTSASVFPKVVDGYVRDLSGLPVPGANVTVSVYDGATLKGTQYYDSTEGDGFYTVTLEGPQWDPGDEIRVTATYGLESAQNSTVADDGPFQSVDVTMSIVIPEFGTYSGSPVLGLSLGIIAIFAIVASRRR